MKIVKLIGIAILLISLGRCPNVLAQTPQDIAAARIIKDAADCQSKGYPVC